MPGVVVDATVNVADDVPAPVMEVGLKATVTPLGAPDAVSPTAESNPPLTEMVIVDLPLPPCATDNVFGDAERL